MFVYLFLFIETIQRDYRWSVRQPSQIPYLQSPLFQHVIVEIPWMEACLPKPLRREVPHIPGTNPFSRKLSCCHSMGEVTEVLMNLLLFLNPRGAGCLSQTSNSTDLFWGLNKGVTLDIQWQSLEKSPAGLLWHFIWSFLIHWFLTIRDLQITWEFSSS